MLESSNIWGMLAAASIAATLYVATLAAYRIYLSPTSHIPGPRLAACTYWYQAYYDLYPYQGRWLWKQIELHKQYGPIVKVGPDEIHIDSPEWYTEFVGSSTRKRHKSKLWYWFSDSGTPFGYTAFATLDHDHHALRRSALSGFFSKRNVQDLEERIRGHVERGRQRLLGIQKTGKAMNLLHLNSALTMDVITDYSFGASTDILSTPDMGKSIREQLDGAEQIHPIARRFRPLILLLMHFITFASKYSKLLQDHNSFDDLLKRLMDPPYRRALQETGEKKSALESSIIEAIVKNESLPQEERTRKRIEGEGQNLLGAGTETTARTLAVGLFHILNDTEVHSRLLAELRTAMPNADSGLPSTAELARLPYLTACIHESTRLGHGVAGRLVRIADVDLNFEGTKIRRGTTFSMSHYIQHTSREKFPDPFEFKPDRYLNGSESLRYLVPFGKGPRMCAGINLAWSEMYLAIASWIRSVDMELVDTTIRDAQIDKEYFTGMLPRDSKGILVKVNGVQA